MLGNFIAGVLSSFYNNQFQFLQHQQNSQKVFNNHIKCIRRSLDSIISNQQLVRVFENKFVFGGIYPFQKQIKAYFVFKHMFKVLRRKRKINYISKKLKKHTGTFEKIRIFKLRQKEIKSLYRNRNRVKGAAKRILRIRKLSKKRALKKQKRKTKRNFKNFKVKTLKRKLKKWRKKQKISKLFSKIFGKNGDHLADYAQFMTYAYRKIWWFSSFFTRKVISCGISASSRYRTIQKSFLKVYSRNKKVSCKYKFVDVLNLLLNKFPLRNSFSKIFYKLLFKGVRGRRIHRLKWFKIGQNIFTANQELQKLCPWF